MKRLLAVVFLFLSTASYAQTLWGGLSPGPHAVGFKSMRELDNSRNGRAMIVSVWYPGVASAKAKTVLFKDYLAIKADQQTDEAKKAAYDYFHDILERPFISGVKIPADVYNKVLEMPTAAKWNLSEARGKFPVVLMSSE